MRLYDSADVYYIYHNLSYEQNLRNKWRNEEITVKATIERGNDKFGPYRFCLTPSEYDNFKGMKGTFTGFSLVDDDIVINLLPTDVIYIEFDNYDEVKEKFDKDCEEKIEEYRKEQAAKKKKEREEKAEKEKISKEDKEEDKKEVKEEVKEEDKPWYRKIIKFLKELFK